MNAYSVNHMTRSIILTHKFAKAASIPGTDEYKIFLSLRRDNPEYEVLQRTIAKKEGKRNFNTTFNQNGSRRLHRLPHIFAVYCCCAALIIILSMLSSG